MQMARLEENVNSHGNQSLKLVDKICVIFEC